MKGGQKQKMQKNLRMLPMLKNKKGNSGDALLGWIIIFGLIGIIGAIMGMIQSDISADLDNESIEAENLQLAAEAQGKIFGKLPLVGTVVVLSIVLMLVLGIVSYFQNSREGMGQLG